jgi:multiple sugar transport system permease protein
MFKTVKYKQLKYIILATILVMATLFPYYYMITQAFAPQDKVDKIFFNTNPNWESFEYLLNNGGDQNKFMWYKALFNSMFVTSTVAFISVFFGLLVGYSIIKLRYKGHKVIYNFLLFQMFFPKIIMLIPIYLLMKPFANTYIGMIFPTSISIWGIFMFINYFKTLPEAIFEAARIDGASEFSILFHIGLPAAKTVSIIVFLSVFMARWSELMWDMLIAPALSMQTLNVMISTQFRPMGNLPGPLYAAAVLLTLPIIILCVSFSKYFKEGLSFHLK